MQAWQRGEAAVGLARAQTGAAVQGSGGGGSAGSWGWTGVEL